MALDPFVAQLWWNANDPNMAGLPAINAANQLASRFGVTVDWNDGPGTMAKIRAAVLGSESGTSTATPTTTSPTTSTTDPNTGPSPGLVDELRSSFPWLTEIGLSAEFFHDLVATSAGSSEIYSKLRQTQQYRARFSGITRADGSARMTEAQFLARESEYRQVASQYGLTDQYLNRESLIGLFEGETDPNEFRTRLDVWNKIREEGGAVKDAFFVYAGIEKTDEDLFEAAVDPAAAARLTDEYNAKVASSPLDYDTWISRATTLGVSKVTTQLENLRRSGALTGQAVQSFLRTDPNFARQMMDVLYTGGDPNSSELLSLSDLLATFEYAAIGAAARGAGLTMPDRARVAELRAAGVTRARAMEGYSQYGASKGIYSGAAQRLGATFGQREFEDAAFLGDSADIDLLNRATAAEKAAGADQGGFAVQQDPYGRFQQTGLRTP